MHTLRTLHWPLVVGLGVLALLRPLMNMVGLIDVIGRPVGPVLVTVAITAVWIVAVVVRRVDPVPTLVGAGVTYAVLATVLSGVLSPLLTGEFQGPLATPFLSGAVAVVAVNAVWGGLAGVLALAVQRALPEHDGNSSPTRPSRTDDRRQSRTDDRQR